MTDTWRLAGAVKDRQTITARWTPSAQQLIDGVTIREVLNVPKANGYLTEMYRGDWAESSGGIDQVFQVALDPGAISAWHAHADTIDRLFVSYGRARVVLYDGREDSPTHGVVNEFRFGTIRPAMIHIPPRVWHGVENVGEQVAILVNIVDRAYDYEDPDHWRVPADSPEIPFRF